MPGEKRGSISGMPFTREQPEAHQASVCRRWPEGALVGAVGCEADAISIAHDLALPPWQLHGAMLHPPGPRYLCLSEHQRCGHLKTLGSGQILVELELVLQLQELLAGECCAGPTALSHQTRLRGSCRADSGWGSGDSRLVGGQLLSKLRMRRKVNVSIISHPNNGFIA